MLPNPNVKEVTILDYIKIVKKRLGILIVFLIIIPTSVVIIDFLKPPIYRSSASILIEKSLPKITRFEDVSRPEVSYDNIQYFYQTQYKILESRALAERAFDELRLRNDPDFRDLKDPIARLQSQINIAPVKNSQIILLNVEDSDALRASVIANMLAKLYIQQDIEQRNKAAKEATGWLEGQLSDVKKKLESAEKALNEYVQQNKIVAVPDIEKKTETLMESLKAEKSKLESDIAEASKRYKEKHPKMIALRAQYDGVVSKIDRETNNLLDLNPKMVQYNILKKEVESNQTLYISMLSRAKETDLSEKLSVSGIRVVDQAKPSEVPAKPKKMQDFILAVMVALGAGFSVILLLEYLDSGIHTSDDVSMYIDLPFLGYIPATDRSIKSDVEKSMLCHAKPNDKVTELFRTVRTSILFASPEDKPLRTILVTSSMPGEGKSFISANISEVFCHANERIVFLDLDMRRPVIHKAFCIEQSPGMSNFLTGKTDVKSIIQTTQVPGLYVIPSGTIPPNPSELLSSGKIRSLLEDLKTKFDRIIIDSPPILAAADTSLLANIVDGVVMVIKGSSTRIEMALQAKEKVIKAKGKIIGVIINNVQPRKDDSYYYHYYSAYGEKSDKNR